MDGKLGGFKKPKLAAGRKRASGEMTEARTCPGPDPAATPPEPDERDWEEIVHLLEFVDRSALRKMTKPQLVQAILDLLAISSQLQLEKEKRFKKAVENILNRNKHDETKRQLRIEKDKAWVSNALGSRQTPFRENARISPP